MRSYIGKDTLPLGGLLSQYKGVICEKVNYSALFHLESRLVLDEILSGSGVRQKTLSARQRRSRTTHVALIGRVYDEPPLSLFREHLICNLPPFSLIGVYLVSL